MTIHAKVTSKGQITLPKELRNELGINVGDTIDFLRKPEGGYEVVRAGANLSALRGLIRYKGPRLTGDDVVEIVRAARQGKGKQMLEDIKRRSD